MDFTCYNKIFARTYVFLASPTTSVPLRILERIMVTCITTYLNVYATSFKIACKAWNACHVILSEKSTYF